LSSPHQPFIKWYPVDWRADPRLRMCSLAARGLWIELIGYMHEGEPYGYLTINDVAPSVEDIAALVGRPLPEVRKAMAELELRQVYSTDALQGTPYSRRMVRDKAKADTDRINGKGGGNPKLKEADKGGVNPPDKAQIPEAREPEKKDAAPAALTIVPDHRPVTAADLEKSYFDRGKVVLGKNAGGLLANLLKAKENNVALARAAVEQASTKSDPREYIGGIIRKPGGAGAEPVWLDGIPGVI
jgi:hypothetical protein